MLNQYGDRFGLSADKRRAESTAALDASELLREHARRAQDRLDALPYAPSAIHDDDRGRPGPSR